MAITFSAIHDKAARAGIIKNTKESREWFIKSLKDIRSNVSQKALLRDAALIRRKKPLIGRMFMFFYDPKTKDQMPYYDEFPLILMVGPAPGGFYGLNLHYLSPHLRAILFDKLMEHMTNNKYDEDTKIHITYNMLLNTRSLRLFEPCFKRYLFTHIRSATTEVPAKEWEIALFMPTDSFVGQSRQKIWNETRKFLA
jgi:hypothetical protein